MECHPGHFSKLKYRTRCFTGELKLLEAKLLYAEATGPPRESTRKVIAFVKYLLQVKFVATKIYFWIRCENFATKDNFLKQQNKTKQKRPNNRTHHPSSKQEAVHSLNSWRL